MALPSRRMSATERQRQRWCRAGHAVLANARCDHRLIGWAQSTGRLVSIARPGPWGNPEPLDREASLAEREACIARHAVYFATRADLHAQLHTLRGKVLVCWCVPLPCHGFNLLARLDPRFAEGYKAYCQQLVSTNPSPFGAQLPLLGEEVSPGGRSL